jgi:hypothetical protein
MYDWKKSHFRVQVHFTQRLKHQGIGEMKMDEKIALNALLIMFHGLTDLVCDVSLTPSLLDHELKQL